MNLKRFRLTFIVTLVALFVAVELVRHFLVPDFDSWTGRLMLDLVILAAAIFVFGSGFDLLSTMERRLERRSREFAALHEGVEEIYGEPTFNSVLQKIADRAVDLASARYGALLLADSSGTVSHFVTSGMRAKLRAAESTALDGSGDGADGGAAVFRLADVERDPGAFGFPVGHGLRPLLSVPVDCKEPFTGRLYVAERVGRNEFTPHDEETLAFLSAAAAIAIDNAYLNDRLRSFAVAEERARIGGEIHDGMAQILAYVNTKAQAVEGYMETGNMEEAREQLDQLAGAARLAYTDAREGILALRTQAGPGRSFRQALEQFVEAWQLQSGIPAELHVHGEVEPGPLADLQLLRIVQEALANTRKHSEAGRVVVSIERRPGALTVLIQDNGVGFDPAALARTDFPRFGLAIMRERAESVGGTLDVDSSPGGGTRVRINVPLQS
jgi:signal transduction histidine kinase